MKNETVNFTNRKISASEVPEDIKAALKSVSSCKNTMSLSEAEAWKAPLSVRFKNLTRKVKRFFKAVWLFYREVFRRLLDIAKKA